MANCDLPVRFLWLLAFATSLAAIAAALQCGEHGDLAGDRCLCHPGWQGAACDGRLPPQKCPSGCLGRGVCNPLTGSCNCADGFGGEDCSLSIRMVTPDATVSDIPSGSNIVSRGNVAGFLRCYSTGDPHYTAFDGRVYSAQMSGIYWVVYNPGVFLLQTQTVPYANCPRATTNHAFALRYKSTVFEVYGTIQDPGYLFKVNGETTILPTRTAAAIGTDGLEINDLTNRQFSITVPGVGVVSVNRGVVTNVQVYLNVFVTIQPDQVDLFEASHGLCGSSKGAYAKVYRGRDGSITKTWTMDFISSWKVLCSESLFTEIPLGANNCVQSASPSASVPIDSQPTQRPRNTMSSVGALGLESSVNLLSHARCSDPDFPHEEVQRLCQLSCESYAQCIYDVESTCDVSMALSFWQQGTAQALQSGKRRCPSNSLCHECSGHGHCDQDSGRCVCEPAWMGAADCSKEMSHQLADGTSHRVTLPIGCQQPGRECVHGTCASSGMCHCDAMWYGAACDSQRPSDPSDSVVKCSMSPSWNVRQWNGKFVSGHRINGQWQSVVSPAADDASTTKPLVQVFSAPTNGEIAGVAISDGTDRLEIRAASEGFSHPWVFLNENPVLVHSGRSEQVTESMKLSEAVIVGSMWRLAVDLTDAIRVVAHAVGAHRMSITVQVSSAWKNILESSHDLCGSLRPQVLADPEPDPSLQASPPPSLYGHAACANDTSFLNLVVQHCRAYADHWYQACVQDALWSCDLSRVAEHALILDKSWWNKLWAVEKIRLLGDAHATDCSSNGLWHADSRQCSCFSGWAGTDCSQAVCAQDCGSHGECVRPGVCSCDAGYYGQTCSESHCAMSCSGGGTCIVNVDDLTASFSCNCNEGLSGATCESSTTPASPPSSTALPRGEESSSLAVVIVLSVGAACVAGALVAGVRIASRRRHLQAAKSKQFGRLGTLSLADAVSPQPLLQCRENELEES